MPLQFLITITLITNGNFTAGLTEGEMKFYIDGDKEFPTICGNGTEDYFCGAYNFDVNGKYTEYFTPYAGLAVGDSN